MEWHRDEFVISDDLNRVQVEVVADLLAKTFWGHRRPREVVEKLIQTSICFSLFHQQWQIGFSRVVTDYAVFSWLSDLVLNEGYRGRGLGGWLIGCILEHPQISGTQFVLQTTYAAGLYKKFGFQANEKLMTRTPSTW
ncbi:MAG TPA: GNAT family N-acetyltransferase [Thermodesulfobacteriota bacterium]|nr:GNAT family N-acetyltransferase [Thermodesulfobacteriota bacterium]